MRSIMVALLILASCGCRGEQPTPPLPDVKPVQPTTVEEAKKVAKQLNGQVCTISESQVPDNRRDMGTYTVECESGLYTFDAGMSHIYGDNWAPGNAYFEYRDELQMKPAFRESAEPQELNPAYYLVPLPSR